MKLDAQWITGFVDGEGCFHVGINSHHEMTAGFQVLPEFTVVQHERDVQILHALKAYFGCGVVRVNHGDRMAYRVRSLKHLLEHIVPFFVEQNLAGKQIDSYAYSDQECKRQCNRKNAVRVSPRRRHARRLKCSAAIGKRARSGWCISSR